MNIKTKITALAILAAATCAAGEVQRKVTVCMDTTPTSEVVRAAGASLPDVRRHRGEARLAAAASPVRKSQLRSALPPALPKTGRRASLPMLCPTKARTS